MNATLPIRPAVPVATAPDEIRVMVVDDAGVVRSLLSRWIDEAQGMRLVASLKNGREALQNTFISNHYSGENPDPVVQNFRKAYRA